MLHIREKRRLRRGGQNPKWNGRKTNGRLDPCPADRLPPQYRGAGKLGLPAGGSEKARAARNVMARKAQEKRYSHARPLHKEAPGTRPILPAEAAGTTDAGYQWERMDQAFRKIPRFCGALCRRGSLCDAKDIHGTCHSLSDRPCFLWV